MSGAMSAHAAPFVPSAPLTSAKQPPKGKATANELNGKGGRGRGGARAGKGRGGGRAPHQNQKKKGREKGRKNQKKKGGPGSSPANAAKSGSPPSARHGGAGGAAVSLSPGTSPGGTSRKGQSANHLLQFRLAEREPAPMDSRPKVRAPKTRTLKKQGFLHSNSDVRFSVSPGGDYSRHAVDPEQKVAWVK